MVLENYEDSTFQPGHPPPVEVPTEPPQGTEEPSRDDLDMGMHAVEQMTSLEGAGETAPSTENRRAINFVEGMWSEYWTAGSGRNPLRGNCWKSSVQKGLEEPLDDEQEKTGEDETELIGPEDLLMTKSHGELFWTYHRNDHRTC